MRKPKAARLATIEESPEEEISEIDHHIKKEQEMRQRLAISDRETRRAHNCPYFWETLNALSIHYLPKYDINWLWSHCIIIDPQFRALAAIREEGEMHESMKKVIDEYKQWASINQDGPINLEVRHVRDRGQSQQDYEARVDEFLAVLHLLDPEMLLEMSIYSRTFEVEEDDGRMPYYANRMPWSCTTCLGLGYYEHHRAGYREAGKPIVPPHKRDSYQTKPLKIPQSNLLSYHSADTDDEIGDLRAATASLFIYDAKGDIIHNDGNVPPRPPSLVDQFRFWMPDKDYRFTVTDIENLVKRAKRNARRHDREIHELHTSRVQALYSYQKHVFEEALKQEENERASSGNSIGEKSLLDKSDSKNRNFDLPSRVHFTFPDLWKDPKTYIPIGWSAIRQHLKDKWHPPGDPDVDPRVSAAKRKKDKRVKENLWGFYKCLAWWIFSSSVLWLILWAVMWRGQDLDRDDLGVHRNGGNTVGFCVATQYPPWFGDCRQVMLDEAKRQWREQQAQEGSDNKGTETGEGEGDNPADSADPGEISDPEIVEWKPEQDPVPGWVKTDIEGLY